MLEASIHISSIDYEQTLRSLFPKVSEKMMSMESKRLTVRLFRQLGDAALPILVDLMNRLPEGTKDALLVGVLNAYSPDLTEKLNQELARDQWGQYFRVGAISVTQEDEIHLRISQIQPNYQALIQTNPVSSAIGTKFGMLSGLARTAAGFTVAFAPEYLERKGLDLLWQEENRQRLLKLFRHALEKHGIGITLSDIELAQSDREAAPEIVRHLALTDQMEDELISALAGYLREHSGDTGEPAVANNSTGV